MKSTNKKAAFIFALFSCAVLSHISSGQNFVWTQKASFAPGNRSGAYGFSIGNKGYVGSGLYDSLGVLYIINDFWEYDPQTDVWTQMANLPGLYRASASSFSIGQKGYVCNGSYQSGFYLNDMWEYDASGNLWTQKANFPGAARYTSASFVIGNYAYVGMGKSGPWYSDFYRYDPANDLWIQIADIGGPLRQNAKTFTIGNFGYVAGGATDNNNYFDLWQYDPVNDLWTQKTSYPGSGSYAQASFDYNGSGYIGTGSLSNTSAPNTFDDFYSYDPVTDTWTYFTNFAGGIRNATVSMKINNDFYMGLGSAGVFPVTTYQSDWWKLEFTTAVNETIYNNFEINAYPNPANSYIYFNFTNDTLQKLRIKIFDSTGKICFDNNLKEGSENMIDVLKWTGGIYLYEVVLGQKILKAGRVTVIH
jgi:N-acetylneuraminic acid mutarotase